MAARRWSFGLLRVQSRLRCVQSVSRCSSSAGPRIYTRTGDQGYSSTYGGERRQKTDPMFEALGTTDELSCFIGMAREFCKDAGHGDIMEKLEEVQCVLQDVSSNVATPRQSSSEKKLSRTQFSHGNVTTLENWIDEYHNQLPPLRNFILPSGGKSSTSLHIARSVCRRAERRVMPLVLSESVDPDVGKYLNRLSDFLFTISRLVCKREGNEETVYHRVQR